MFKAPVLAEAIVIFLFSVVILTDWSATGITISIVDKKLLYRKMNFFGKEKTVEIFLPDARISYKYGNVSRYTKGRCLQSYNSFFRNRVSLKQDDKQGYSKEQLDRMFALINQCRKEAG